MKVMKKIAIICIFVNFLFVFISLNQEKVYADFISDIDSSAKGFITAGSKKATGMTSVTNTITKNFKGIGQLLTMIGAGVMVAVVTYMGIKYMTASPDKQAALKQQLIGVVVAGVVIFGAYGIWSALVNILNSATS